MSAEMLWAGSVARRRRGSLLLLTFLIAATGAMTLAALAGSRRASTAIERFSAATRAPDLSFFYNFNNSKDIRAANTSIDVFEKAAGLPGVTGAMAAAVWAVTPGPELEPWQIGPARLDGQPGRTFIVSGRAPRLDAADEVLLNEAAARALGVEVGDTLTLHTAAAGQFDEWISNFGYVERLAGPEIPVRVTGISRGIEDIAQFEDLSVSVTPAFYDAHHDDVVNCVCFSQFSVDPEMLPTVRAQLEQLYAPYGFMLDDEEQAVFPQQAADGIDIEVVALRLLALASAVAGVVVVAQAMNRELADTARDDDVRRAIGTTTRGLVRSSVMLLAPATLFGVAGAVVLAIFASSLFPRGLARQAEVDPGIRIDGLVLVAGAAALLVGCFAMSFLAAHRVSSPRRRAKSRVGPLPTGLPPAPMLGVAFATRPGRRGRAGLWSALLATAVATVGGLGVWTFEASRSHLLHEPKLFGIDADLGAGGDTPDQVERIAADAANRPGIAALSIWQTLSSDVTIEGPAGQVPTSPNATVPLKGQTGPTVVEGRLPASPSEVAVGRALLDATGVNVGGLITVASPGGPIELTVVGEVIQWDTDEVDGAFTLTSRGLESLTAACSEFECEVASEEVAVRLTDDGDGAATRAQLLDEGWVSIPLPSVVDNLGQAGPVPTILGVFLVGMGTAGLAHSAWLMLKRRRKDVAVARSIGLGTRGVRSCMRWNAGVVVLTGLVLGIPTGIAAGRVAWESIARRLGVVVEPQLSWWVPVLVGGFLGGIGLLVAQVTAQRAARLRPSEILRTE